MNYCWICLVLQCHNPDFLTFVGLTKVSRPTSFVAGKKTFESKKSKVYWIIQKSPHITLSLSTDLQFTGFEA